LKHDRAGYGVTLRMAARIVCGKAKFGAKPSSFVSLTFSTENLAVLASTLNMKIGQNKGPARAVDKFRGRDGGFVEIA
jgi:hypothetical protein